MFLICVQPPLKKHPTDSRQVFSRSPARLLSYEGSEKPLRLDALIGFPTIDFSSPCLRDSGQNRIKMLYNKTAMKCLLLCRPMGPATPRSGLLTASPPVLRAGQGSAQSWRRPPKAVCITLRRSSKRSAVNKPFLILRHLLYPPFLEPRITSLKRSQSWTSVTSKVIYLLVFS